MAGVAERRRNRDERMPRMMQPPAQPDHDAERPVRDLADAYVQEFARLDPLVATMLGLPEGQDELPDLSPAGWQALDELRPATHALRVDTQPAAEPACGVPDGD